MNLIVLDTNQKIVRARIDAAATTTNPSFTSHWYAPDATDITEGNTNGQLNGTTFVTLVAAPSTGRRVVKEISICNIDTVDNTVILQLYDGTTGWCIIRRILQPNETLYLSGLSTEGPPGPPGASDHQLLSNLAWQNSDHTGTVDTVAGFNSTGDAAFYGLTGDDANVVTGTAGTAGNLAGWDADGNAVDSGIDSGDVLTETILTTTERIYTAGQASTQVVITPSAGDLDYDLADSDSFRSTIASNTELQLPTWATAALPANFAQSYVIKITFSANADLTFVAGYFDGDTALPTINGTNGDVYLLYCYTEENSGLIDVNLIQQV